MAFTYFFRDEDCLRPAITAISGATFGRQRILVWDAGCADGPEPYTVAILLAEQLGHFQFRNVRIDATDVDESGASSKAISDGAFTSSQLERVPPELRQKYFIQQPHGSARVSDDLRQRVHFRRHDLLALDPLRTGYHLVVCKNVLLHFSAEQRAAVIQMFHAALDADGVLVMEQTQPLPEASTRLFARTACHAAVYRKMEPLP